jgi:putative transposase
MMVAHDLEERDEREAQVPDLQPGRDTRRPASAGPGDGRPGDGEIVEVAKANPTDGTRMVAALASRELGEAVNRKRAQRVMRAHGLLQPTRGSDRRRRPGFFRVTRPDELWHMDMTKVWTAAHGWVYLHVIIDCCTREIVAWTLDLRTRSTEAIACVDAALRARGVRPATLTIGTDNGSQFTSREFRRHLSARGLKHRRGGYHDPQSQAFIESWFGQFKKRCAWRAEWESIDHARRTSPPWPAPTPPPRMAGTSPSLSLGGVVLVTGTGLAAEYFYRSAETGERVPLHDAGVVWSRAPAAGSAVAACTS